MKVWFDSLVARVIKDVLPDKVIFFWWWVMCTTKFSGIHVLDHVHIFKSTLVWNTVKILHRQNYSHTLVKKTASDRHSLSEISLKWTDFYEKQTFILKKNVHFLHFKTFSSIINAFLSHSVAISFPAKVISVGITTIKTWYNYHQDLDRATSRADDIWNMDESGIFFKALPDTGLRKKIEKCKGGKKSNERLTVTFLCPLVHSRYVNLFLLEKVKFRDAFKNCLILLNRMVCSIFTAKKHGWLQKLWFRFLPP